MHEDIIVAARRLTEATGARAVVLFGSRARGDATQDSDWDMCVLLPDDIRPGQFTAQTLHPLVADLDPVIQVYPMRKSVYDEARHDPGSVSSEVYHDGILISGTVDLAPRGMRP